MQVGSILAIYFLFFVGAAFILLPFGVKTDEEVGNRTIPGQADSAPHAFDLKRHLVKAALLGLVLFAVYYANWYFGWIGTEAFDFYNPS